MKFINQNDYPDMKYLTVTDKPGDPYGTSTTVKSSACGLCSAIMVLGMLRPDASFTVEEAVQLSYDTHANHQLGTDGKIYFPAFAEKFNLRYRSTNALSDVEECLRTGGTAIALVANRAEEGYVSVFTRKEHYITIIGKRCDGLFEILDPNLYEGKFEEPDRKGRVQLMGQIALTDGDVLTAETEKIVRRSENADLTKAYHLFWRKQQVQDLG